MLKLRNIKFISVIFGILISLSLMCGISVYAEDYSAVICDDYEALSPEEEVELSSYLSECSQQAGVNIAIVITDETDKYGAMDYADVYEEKLFGINSNSILYLINMNDGYDWISCSGTAMDYYPDDTIQNILSNTSGMYLMDSNNMDFYGAIKEFGDLVITSQHSNLGFILIAIGIGIIVSIIVCIFIARSYLFHANVNANIYVKSSDKNFLRREDRFIRTYTTKVKRETQSSGSSTHISSGGGTHSGGGFQR